MGTKDLTEILSDREGISALMQVSDGVIRRSDGVMGYSRGVSE